MNSDLENCFKESFNLNSNIIFFPVRHHSPACSYHLLKVIEDYNPEAILIEGPEDSNNLIRYIIDETTEPPFCIYSSYSDEEGIISEDKERYRCYYPFVDYSPEYAALKEANKRNIFSSFIDMPYPLMLVNETVSLNDSSLYDYDNKKYDSNTYTSMLTKKSGLRSFSEFWESYFEINGLKKQSEDFVKSVFSLGYFMRLLDKEVNLDMEENLKREYYMAKNIAEKSKKYKKIIAVTGSFHVLGIMEVLKNCFGKETDKRQEISFKRYDLNNASSYIIPYSFEDIDQRKGYKAGIEFPAFYQRVWENIIKENNEDVYEAAVKSFIILSSRAERDLHNITIPDSINALYMAKNLSRLRDKKEPGVYELIDSAKSAFIKGEISKTNTSNLEFMFKILSGLKMGKVSSKTIVPPVVIDFRNMCRKYKIKTTTIAKQETTLDIIKNQSHYEKSKFFHKMSFLQLNFCTLLQGPDYVNKKDRNLAREIWQYSYKTDIETSLIDLSVYGVTITDMCLNIIRKRLSEILSALEISKLIINAYVIGANNFLEDNFNIIENIILKDSDFVSLCSALSNFSYLFNMDKANRNITLEENMIFNSENKDISIPLSKIAKKTFDISLYNIMSLKNLKEEEAFKAGMALKCLYSFTIEHRDWCNIDNFNDSINRILENTFGSSHIYGVCLSIKYKEGLLSLEDFSKVIGSFLESTSSSIEDSSYFIAGILLISRDILFVSNDIIDKIDDIIKSLSNEDFLRVLPNFRYAFTSLMPSEIERLSKTIAVKYETSSTNILENFDVDMEEIKKGMEIDAIVLKEMKNWEFI